MWKSSAEMGLKHPIIVFQVTGVWERPLFTEICWLFSGNMFINVRTTAYAVGEIHGQLKQFTFRGHHLSYHGKNCEENDR